MNVSGPSSQPPPPLPPLPNGANGPVVTATQSGPPRNWQRAAMALWTWQAGQHTGGGAAGNRPYGSVRRDIVSMVDSWGWLSTVTGAGWDGQEMGAGARKKGASKRALTKQAPLCLVWDALGSTAPCPRSCQAVGRLLFGAPSWLFPF